MNLTFNKFLILEGSDVADRYLNNYHGQEETRNRWHKGNERSYDFWDERNWARFISGAFTWEKTREGYGYWARLSEKWRDYHRRPPQLNKNTKTI